jgi:hypothetical protein
MLHENVMQAAAVSVTPAVPGMIVAPLAILFEVRITQVAAH